MVRQRAEGFLCALLVVGSILGVYGAALSHEEGAPPAEIRTVTVDRHSPPVVIEKDSPTPDYSVTVEEDGSGTQYVAGEVVRTFPVDTFVWDCQSMGNYLCDPGQKDGSALGVLSPGQYREIAEDGSADDYGPDASLIRSFPADTYPADGSWHACGVDDDFSDPLCRMIPRKDPKK